MAAEYEHPDGVVVFALPRAQWSERENAATSHFRGVVFGTEEEALDWCYEYSTDTMKWSPYQMDFYPEALH